MAYTIDVQGTSRYPASLIRVVAAAANEAMAHEGAPAGAALTILLTDDAYLRDLNSRYRGEEHATDVLSFPAGEPLPGSEGLLEYLGDIAVSVPFAQRQADRAGHALEAEAQLLAVHGVLHLLGYDHVEADEKAAMWTAQAAILRKLGLEGIQPTEVDYDEQGE